MNSIVKLQVNETRLVKNLALAFSSNTTFIAELMQNARRAGASVIQITYTAEKADGKMEGTLVIEDNGGGIKNWQDLLSIADSGWSEGIQEEERPYGMGFFSCLATAQSVKIESGVHLLAFDQESVLGFESLQVVATETPVNGTRISLMGLSLDQSQVRFALDKYCKGFPVQVIFNGTEMEQQYSPAALKANVDDFEAVVELDGIGFCAFRKATDRFNVRRLTLSAYLLGLPVLNSSQYADIIIHLDPRHFPARLPDRDTLIDEKEKLAELKGAVEGWWLKRMGSIKAQVSIEVLWEKYRPIALQMLEYGLLNDVDRIPGFLVEQVSDVTMLSWEVCGSPFPRDWVFKSEVESGAVILCRDLCTFHDGLHAVAHEVAAHQGWYRMRTAVDQNHWIRQGMRSLIVGLDEAEVDFESAASESTWLDGTEVIVHQTDKVVLRWMGQEVTVVDSSVAFGTGADEVTLIMAGDGSVHDAVRKVGIFSGDGDYTDDAVLSEAERELHHLLLTLQGASPATSLKSVLADTEYKYLGNTQNTCVLVQNAAQAHELYTYDVSCITEAVTLYRQNGMQDEKVMGLLEGMLKELAAQAMKHEQYVLKNAIHASFCNQGSMSDLLGRDPTESFKTSLIEQFTARVVGMSNWDEIQKDIDAAVKARIDALMADPAL